MWLTCFSGFSIHIFLGVKAPFGNSSKKIEFDSNEVSNQDNPHEASDHEKQEQMVEQEMVVVPSEHGITRSTFV